MNKVAYQLVTDLHYGIKKASRICYLNEVLTAMASIMGLAENLKRDGYDTKLILLGDVVDVSLSDASDAMQATEALRVFFDSYSEVFSLIGNHELTYRRRNPFWYLVQDIEDASFKNTSIATFGLNPVIRIVDHIDNGNVRFYFNHYGVPTKTPETVGNRINIGLFHKDIGSESLCQMWGNWEDIETGSSSNEYHYMFFGHMHQAFGRYELSNGCIAEWLGSIGRTNHTEVDNAHLDRVIPAIKIIDGEFDSVQRDTITLLSREQCVNENQQQAETIARSITKEIKEKSTNVRISDSLKDTVIKTVMGTGVEYLARRIFGKYSSLIDDYKASINGQSEHLWRAEDGE